MSYETMPIPTEWLRDLLENEASAGGEYLSPDDVVLDDEDEPGSRRHPAAGGAAR